MTWLNFIGWLCKIYFTLSEPGPALGIGRECDGLGPMPLGGPKKIIMERGVYRNTRSLRGLYSKVH